MGVRAAAAISIVLIGATLSPLVRDPADDSFPLSTYPMFAYARPTTQTVDYAIGVTADGGRRTLDLRHLGTGEVLQARAAIEQAMRASAAERHAVCVAIATSVGADADYGDVVAVRLVTGTHDAVEYLLHDVVGRELERARCVVPR